MSLYKQLTLMIVGLFLLVFAGSYWLNFASTQSYLQRQMQSQAQDAATSLGLSLMPALETEDVSGVETTVNAIFDRGFYQEIAVYDYDDQQIARRQQGVQLEGVPGWFVNLVQLAAPTAQQELSAGWALAGRVVVTSNPGYAYQQLWGVVTSSFSAYLAVFLLLLVAGYFALRYLLSPLYALVGQARAICNRQFDQQLPIPKVPELAMVVRAMNQMSASVKATFAELSQSVSQLREQAYQDSVTGLGNKRFFQAQLTDLIEEKTAGRETVFSPGSLFLIQLNDFKGFNARAGYKKGDALLEAVAQVLRRVVENQPVQALSRLSGGDFAFFLGTENDEVADRLADSLSNELATLHHSEFFDGPQLAKLGVATIHKPLSYGKALTRADSALRMAQSKAGSSWIRVSELDASDIHSMSRNEWNQHITQCVENADFNLLGQTVVAGSDTGAVLHREVFLQMVDKASQSIPAARFIATCNELRLSASIDRKVIAELIKQLKTRRSSERYAINLSSQSIEGPELVTWLREELAACGDEASDIASHLIFEFSESTVVEHLGELRAFSAAIRELGCGLGVDQFGKTFADFAYLNSIRPDYVKIDQVYTHELLEDQDAQFFVKSLCGICRSLDIAVIAQAVESEEQAATLTAAGVSGLQGYSIERPVPLDLSR